MFERFLGPVSILDARRHGLQVVLLHEERNEGWVVEVQLDLVTKRLPVIRREHLRAQHLVEYTERCHDCVFLVHLDPVADELEYLVEHMR